MTISVSSDLRIRRDADVTRRICIDECWSLVGSTNMDARSLELNAELSVGIDSVKVAAILKQAFERELKECRRIRTSELTAVSWHQRWIDALAYQLHEQL